MDEPPLSTTPLCICNQEERIEESVEVREVEEGRLEEREGEDTSGEAEVNNSSQERMSISTTSSSQ
jgi:hypothetical protein